MKHNMKRVLSIVALLMLTLGTWAGQVIIVKNPTTGGTVTASGAAAGQTCTLTVKPNSGFYLESLTAVTTLDGGSLQAPMRRTDINVAAGEELEISSDPTADPSGETTHTFTMPTDGSLNVEVTVNFQSYQSYNLFIGETQVTELNKDKVLGDGKVMFSVVGNDAPVYTLTLNGATLTVPIKVGLPNLTIDIQGENKITTDVACIQTKDDATPALTFKSTNTELGSLSLKSTEDYVSDINNVTVSKELAPIIPNSGAIGGYSSNLYYWRNGVSNAKFVPSYGVQVYDLFITPDNYTDVFGDGTVSFTPTSPTTQTPAKLTLNNASISYSDWGSISTWLPELTIELVGNNMLSSSSYSTLQSLYGVDVAITVQSTGATKGCLVLKMGYSSENVFLGEHVTLETTDPLAVVSGNLNVIEENNLNVVTIGEPVDYELLVEDIRVVAANASNITNSLNNQDRPHASFDASTNTLTLDNSNFYYAWLGSKVPVQSNIQNLKVKLVGDNEVTLGSKVFKFIGTNPETTPTLTFDNSESDGSNSYGKLTIKGISSVDNISDGYAISNSSTWLGDGSKTEGWKYSQSDTKVEVWYQNEVYDLNVAGVEVTSANASNVLGDQGTPTVVFTPAKAATQTTPAVPATLTLNGAAIDLTDDDFHGVKYLGSGDLTIKLIGENSIKTGQGFNPFLYDGDNETIPTLTFESGSQSCSLLMESTNSTVIKSFSNVYGVNGISGATGNLLMLTNTDNDELHYYYYNNNDNNGKYGLYTTEEASTTVNAVTIASVSLEKVAPTMSGEAIVGADGIKLTLSTNYNYGTIKYNVNYVDENEEDITNATYNSEDKPVIIKPATVTAYISENDQTSATTTGKYFGFANGNELNVTYGTTQVAMPSLVPTIAEADGVTIAKEGNFTDDGKTTIDLGGKTIGKAQTTIITSLTASDNTPYTLLNTSVNLNVNILPPAPTIAFDETKNYLNSDKVSISLPEALLEDENATIKYSWDADCEPGNANNYKNEAMVTLNAGTNTLYAWVRYNGATANDAVYSERVSQAFTAKTDINQLAVKDLLTAQPTYTGEAIVPPFTLYDAKDETNTVSADNYNVRYIKYMGEAVDFSDVESILGVGTYRVYAVGKGTTYGGEKLIYEVLEVNPATVTEVNLSATSLPYSGNAKTVEITSVKAGDLVLGADDYTVSYEKINDDETTTSVEAENVKAVGSYNVVVTGQGNFTGTARASFHIINRTLVVGEGGDVQFASGQNWATYYSADGDVELPEGIGAFVATGVSDSKLTVSQISYIPEKVAVLLNKNTLTAGTVAFNPEEDTNLLKHADAVVNVDITNDNSAFYGLYNNKMKRLMDNIPAGKNYLKIMIANNVQPHAPLLSIVIEGEGSTTGVSDVRSKMAEVGGDYYDLSGRKLSGKPSKKGLYIQNGKMVVVNNK